MNILIAPNSMKGSLNAFDFAEIAGKAFRECSKEFNIRKVPVADGGDFTGEILKKQLNAHEISVNVRGPFGKPVQSKFAIAKKTAIIEMADASGMKLVVSKKLNPLKASSFGTGQLIREAIDRGCNKIFLAIGGSATVDGGMGMLEALGGRFFNEKDQPLTGNGENLAEIKRIQLPKISHRVTIKIICDVDNPLLGPLGAAAVFAPQKGATTQMIPLLEAGLKNWSALITQVTGKELARLDGAGAAGGIAVPLVAFFNAEIMPGAQFVLKQLNFEEQVTWADIVITGEGKIDSQTLRNKAPFAVAQVARNHGKPVFAIGGKVESEASPAFDGIFSFLNGPISFNEAIKNTPDLLYNFCVEFARSIRRLDLSLK